MYSGKVFDLSSDGWGVVKAQDGRIVFVPGTWIDDEIEFEIIQEGKFNLGRVVSWSQKSSAQREYSCSYSGNSENNCGGCPWGNIHYSDQVTAKKNKLLKSLSRFKISFEKINEVVSSPAELGYRNRLTVHKKGNAIGLYSQNSKNLVDIENCLACTDEVNNKLQALRKSVDIKDGSYLLQEASHDGFLQGNTHQNKAMQLLLEKTLTSFKSITQSTELFCGDGNFTSILSQYSKVKAYESSDKAIARLKDKNISGVTAQTLDLYAPRALPLLIRENKESEILLIDPPRSGYKDLAELLKQLKNIKKVVYVSCNVMTFSRDISTLEKEWKGIEITPFDLFPQTPHLEVFAILER